jgi:acyl carrier protein phosphodiesterase
MNFLGHLYLSGDNENVKLGNFIGDFVKGNKYLSYPDEVREGILLHRRIDHFTDTHPIVKEVSVLFKPDYGRYSGVVVDLFFDHLLAKHWNNFSSWRLRDFTRNTHAILLSNFWLLPGKVKQFLPFLIQNKRLESYATEDGIRKVLELMSRYTSLPDSSDSAMMVLAREQDFLYRKFVDFMDDIMISPGLKVEISTQ